MTQTSKLPVDGPRLNLLLPVLFVAFDEERIDFGKGFASEKGRKDFG